ncbi:MAG: ATP-dependent helicase [Candidatus Methanomethylophilaceae archaeon]|nr:ATP-dependent helicase [Candidatus Methanomethylophilaceae archaeon]
MIERIDRVYSKDEVMGMMEPLISTWFDERFDDLTIPQAMAIPVIHRRSSVLVSSPTGSGKTLTAFTSIINELTRYAREGTLEERVYCIYVSPLKALANDVNRNLNTPLAEMREVAERHGMNVPDIRVAVRSGDTPQNERQKMVRHPPHILITTPESLALILAAPKFKEAFKKVEWIILDEIHDICDSKRGAFLSLTLERLRHHCESDFTRIGLSATLAPIEAIASYLVGCNPDGTTRDVVLIESGSRKQLDLRVICPTDDMTALSSDVVNSMMYDTLHELVLQHETTLVFTNTRSGAESVVYKLKERGLENIEVHHSSLSKEIRLDVEERLKRGEIKCVVSSTSLELGIDIGSVDLVCQIGSPKSVAKGLQRIGRSGHSFGKVAKGRLLVFDPDDLVECAVMCRAAHRGDIDRVGIPENCLDVLSQTVVGMSLDSRWDVSEAYDVVKGAYCYRDLPRKDFDNVLRYLGSKDDFEGVYSKIWYDAEQGQFGKKKGSRMIYFMNLGTIPEEANYRVVTSHGSTAGELSEKFVERLSPRDVFVLGGRSYEFVRSKGMTAYVKEANGRKPTVPSWAGEMLPRSFDLSMDIARFRREMSSRIQMEDRDAITGLMEEFDVNEGSARSMLSYFREQHAVSGFIPDCDVLAVEEYIDPSGNQKLVFHFPFGRRVNDALSRAYAYRMSGLMGANVSVTISDDSFMLGCPRKFDLSRIVGLVTASELDPVLRKSLKDSEIFKLRFRHTAARSFMILRNYMGRPISVNRQQVRSTYLLETLGDMENVPVIEETYREVLEDDMDIKNAKVVLDMIGSGGMRVEVIPYKGTPSPFAHSAILSGFSDIVLMEDRSALLRELHRKVLYRALGDSVNEFEFTEDQIIPYYAQKPSRIACKDDIPRLLLQTGPLQAIRERGRNIYTYTDEDKKTVDGWVRELLREGRIGTVYMDDVHIMESSEIPWYAAATRRHRELNDLDSQVLEYMSQPSTIAEIAAEVEASEDAVSRSLRKLESMYIVSRVDVDGRGKWTFDLVEYPEIDRFEAIDRIMLRFLECFAPTTVPEAAYALSVPDDDARASLESLTASEEVVKGRFLISENDQYMLKLDHMRLRSGNRNSFDYDTVERYRLSKGGSFESIRDYFEFYGSAGNELDVYNRVPEFDLANWYAMRDDGDLLLGRFVRGKVRYVLKEDGDRFATLRHEDIQQDDLRVLNMIDGMGCATMRQLLSEMNMEKEELKERISRLDRSLLIIRAFDEKEDWGTENTYAPYRPSEPEGDSARILLEQAIRAYGPIPSNALRFMVDLPLDIIEGLASDIGAVVISVGDGQVPMFVMPDELPLLEDVSDVRHPVRILSLSDPDLGSRWAEIASRYGDKWIYPVVRGTQVLGAIEMWEMSGCIEIRGIDLDDHGLLGEFLDAVDHMMGFYRMKGTDIVRIREVFNTDASQLESGIRDVLSEKGYHRISGFYAKGRMVPWTMSEPEMVSYVFRRQRVPRNNRYQTVMEAVADRGYIRGDQEILTRVVERTTMKKQMEKGYLMKMTLTPSFQGYATRDTAWLYRASKGYVPEKEARDVIAVIKDRQPLSKKDIIDNSPYSADRTSDIISELSHNSVLYQDSDSLYNLVQLKEMEQYDAQKEVARRLFHEFGMFSAETMSQFLSARMSVTRRILSDLEDEGLVVKGFLVRDDPVLRWMISEDVGKRVERITDSFVLNTQDNLHVYLRDIIKRETGSSKAVIFNGSRIVGSFKGKLCSSGVKVEEFEGTDGAARILKETAQALGQRLDSQREREDDDWDVSEFYMKVNPGA